MIGTGTPMMTTPKLVLMMSKATGPTNGSGSSTMTRRTLGGTATRTTQPKLKLKNNHPGMKLHKRSLGKTMRKLPVQGSQQQP